MCSRIVAKFFDHDRGPGRPARIAFLYCSLQVRGDVALWQPAYQPADTQRDGQDGAAKDEFEAPAPCREGGLGGL
ncbi:hypothetical protein D3C83_165440 [compost metagenome]